MNLAIDSDRQQIENTLESLLPQLETGGTTLREAARYAVLGGGKRLRPLLSILTCRALGGDITQILQPACAVELIHCYSMVHDDLPCMDDDDFRRGRPTVHRAFDEATAVLVGDLLLTLAFELLATAPYLEPSTLVAMTRTLASYSGEAGLVGGQYLDLLNSPTGSAIERVEAIHLGKTAALITAAIDIGALAAGASSESREQLRIFGRYLGLAFQIADDILDITHSERKHGRQISSDLLQEKATYATLLGVEAASTAAQAAMEKATDALHSVEADTDALAALAEKFINREC